MMNLALNREEIGKLIKKDNLVENYLNLETQLTPNGFDLTVAKIFAFDASGALDFSNKERIIPAGREILPKKINSADKYGWWNLKKGVYRIITNEVVNLPYNLIALGFSRTSLLRMGGFTRHGVWDAGFRGRSEFILVVENSFGVKLKQNSRIAQLIFIKIKKTTVGYSGIYQYK